MWFLDLVNGNADRNVIYLVVDNTRSDSHFDFDLAWRLRLIHGGADAKTLMWIAILIPSWNVVNVVYPENMDNAIIVLPFDFFYLFGVVSYFYFYRL